MQAPDFQVRLHVEPIATLVDESGDGGGLSQGSEYASRNKKGEKSDCSHDDTTRAPIYLPDQSRDSFESSARSPPTLLY
jgi:hypothetical protein